MNKTLADVVAKMDAVRATGHCGESTSERIQRERDADLASKSLLEVDLPTLVKQLKDSAEDSEVGDRIAGAVQELNAAVFEGVKRGLKSDFKVQYIEGIDTPVWPQVKVSVSKIIGSAG